jgi:HSP20 family protein
MCKISSAMNFIKTTHSTNGRAASTEGHWVPNTDVYVTDGGVVIKVELAGMRKEDLELTVEGQQLKISGHREDSCRPPKCNFQLMEINYGPFESQIELPAGYDLSLARAAYQNGFLRIDVPVKVRSAKKGTSVSVTEAP